MSGVSSSGPSDGGYKYYQSTVAELEAQLAEETKRAKKRYEERAESLEDNYRTELEKRDRKLDDTVSRIKENSSDALARDRENAKAENDRLKAQTYDRSGRYSADKDVLKQQLESAQKEGDLRVAHEKANLTDSQEVYERRLQEQQQQMQDQAEKSAATAREASIAASGRATDDERTAYDQFRNDTQEQYNALNRTRVADLNFERRRTQQAVEDVQKDYNHRFSGLQEATDRRLSQDHQRELDDLRGAAQRMTESHDADTRQLREQLGDLLSGESAYVKEKGQGRRDAIGEFENDWRTRERLSTESYERDLGKLKQTAKESDSHFTQVNNQALKEKDAYFANMIKVQANEAHAREQELQKTFVKDTDQLQIQTHRDHQLADQRLDQQRENSEAQKSAALEGQARAYEETLGRQKAADGEKIDSLSASLHERATSSDTHSISPGAEAAVRKSVVREYEKNFEADRLRNQRTTESIQREYSQRLHDTILQKEGHEALITQQHAAERNYDRNEFLQNVGDAEQQKNLTLRTREEEHQQQTDTLSRNHATSLERQRQDYEEMLQAQRNDAIARITATHQDGDFKLKMEQRAFATKQNELIRGYDKKLADQKQEFNDQKEELKAQGQQAVREGERKSRQSLDEQARGYEQRIAQMENQYKERERYITQSYQDDLERVKRSNALLIQKKS